MRQLTPPRPKMKGQESHRKLPNRGVILLTATGLHEVTLDSVSCETVGQKAFGLLTLPLAWTLPFFVVMCDMASTSTDLSKLKLALDQAAARAGVKTDKVIIRSNAETETIADRGSLLSQQAEWSHAADTILRLSRETDNQAEGKIHWIVQNVAFSYAQGQLSNERRISRENRDWLVEVERGTAQQTAQPISVRAWRIGKNPNLSRLKCKSFLQISVALRQVAQWA